jgi:hypothetical protein
MGALRLVPAATFDAPIKLTVAGADEPATVLFTFARKSKHELKAWIDSAANRQDTDFLGEVVKGWKAGVLDAEGNLAPFTAEAFAQLLDQYPVSGLQIYNGYLASYGEARAKN